MGLDYAHSTVYFDIGRMMRFPDFDVVGLVLRPEDDGRYTILKVAEFEGKPSVAGVQAGDELVAVDDIPVHGSTMGQVWSMLGGTPGQETETDDRARRERVRRCRRRFSIFWERCRTKRTRKRRITKLDKTRVGTAPWAVHATEQLLCRHPEDFPFKR